MTKRTLAAIAIVFSACASERLTGPAAEDAARRYQATAASAAPTPLFFLDGKEISAEQARTVDPKTINSVEILKGPAAIQAHGERARDGVVFITSKTGPGAGIR